MGDLRVRTWFGVVENLDGYVLLGTLSINCYFWGIFPSHREIVRLHFRAVAITSVQKTVNSIAAETKELDVNTIGDHGTQTVEHYLCCIRHRVTIPAYLLAVVLVSSRQVGLMWIETLRFVVERRCSMTLPASWTCGQASLFTSLLRS